MESDSLITLCQCLVGQLPHDRLNLPHSVSIPSEHFWVILIIFLLLSAVTLHYPLWPFLLFCLQVLRLSFPIIFNYASTLFFFSFLMMEKYRCYPPISLKAWQDKNRWALWNNLLKIYLKFTNPNQLYSSITFKIVKNKSWDRAVTWLKIQLLPSSLEKEEL